MLFPSFAPRITTYDGSGNPLHRWTLQHPQAGGRALTVTPVVKESEGRPPLARRALVLQGFRIKFECQWDYGLSSFQETWSGTAWTASTEKQTAMALIDIAQACENWPVFVETTIGISDPWQFLGRTFTEVQEVKDKSGTVHKQLIVTIESESLLATMPDFSGYFVPGYFQTTPAGEPYIG